VQEQVRIGKKEKSNASTADEKGVGVITEGRKKIQKEGKRQRGSAFPRNEGENTTKGQNTSKDSDLPAQSVQK